MLLFVLVKVPPVNQRWGLSNTLTGALMLWVKLQQRLSGSAQPPEGRGHGKKGIRTIWSRAAPLGHSREGGMLRAGIHAEQNPPTQPGCSQGEQGAGAETTLPSLLLSQDFERLWPARFAQSGFHLCKQGQNSCTGKCCLAPISWWLLTSQLSPELPFALRVWLPASFQAPLGNCS